ncbi:MAG TPA: CBS domain-containing protein [Gammaproteobacteria bacterium]|jgi:CBS domain-containing protein|nr:CBS domain-containing protein [Gammaproteobacteria bacterium]
MATVKQVLRGKDSEVFTISSGATVYEALELLAAEDIGALPVVDNGRLVGIFSERDYARKVILKGKSSRDTAVDALMTTEVYSVDPDTTIEDCMALMTHRRVRHLPVLDERRLVGIVSIGDVVKNIIAEQRGQIRELRDYVAGNIY